MKPLQENGVPKSGESADIDEITDGQAIEVSTSFFFNLISRLKMVNDCVNLNIL